MADIKAERSDDTIVLEAPVVLKERAKEVPGARWDNATRRWSYPLTWAHCVMLRGVFGESLIVGPELAAWAGEEVSRRVQPARELREAR